MTTADRAQLWQRLCDAGLAGGDMPAASTIATPWYVRLMLGLAGWIGAWFFIGFLGTILALVFRSGLATLGIGALCCAGAAVVFRTTHDGDVVPQFGLAVSLAGQILVVAGLFNLLGEHLSATLYLLIAAFEIGLVAIVAHGIHRAWSTVAATVAMSLALNELGAYGAHGLASGLAAATFAGIWLNEPRWITRGALWRPIGYGVAIALIWFDGFTLATQAISSFSDRVAVPAVLAWLGRAMAGVVLVYAVSRLLAPSSLAVSNRTRLAILAATGVVAVLTIGAPGVAVSLLILVVGFAGGHRTLSGLGVASLLGYLCWFYYSLHATLLTKSVVLMTTGMVLIVAWAGLRAIAGDADREDEHA